MSDAADTDAAGNAGVPPGDPTPGHASHGHLSHGHPNPHAAPGAGHHAATDQDASRCPFMRAFHGALGAFLAPGADAPAEERPAGDGVARATPAADVAAATSVAIDQRAASDEGAAIRTDGAGGTGQSDATGRGTQRSS